MRKKERKEEEEKILNIQNVTKHFGGVKALHKCTFSIEKGKITALIGPNGSGKTTMFDVVSQIVDEDDGKLYFEKRDITDFKAYQVAREGIARTFQDPRLFINLSIQDHLEIALNEDDELLRKAFLIGKQKTEQKEKQKNDEEKIKNILNLVGLDKSLKTLGSDLSYGQRKLLDLAIAIAKPHQAILLDEPVAGVNPHLRKEIKKVLKELKKKGETILLIEHDMNFVMDLADYIFVMDNGTIIVEGKPEQVANNKKVLEAYLGE